jgi:hypothetical protein
LRKLARRIAIELLVAVIIGALLGLLGPFDTYSMGVGPRLAYWIFIIIAGLAIFRPTLIASDWLGSELGWPGWAAVGMAIVIGSMPLTLLIAWLFNDHDMGRALRFEGLPTLYGQVLLISILANGVYRETFQTGAVVVPLLPQFVEPELPAIIEGSVSAFDARLPAGFGPLLALSSEDHYVRAHSETSTALILLRLRDAIAEIEPAIEGMQVHRRWWIAREAVCDQRKEDRALRIILRGGLEVPVSRDRIADIKTRGWF